MRLVAGEQRLSDAAFFGVSVALGSALPSNVYVCVCGGGGAWGEGGEGWGEGRVAVRGHDQTASQQV